MSNITIGSVGRLEGITRHGKNRVKEHGGDVQVTEIRDQVFFSSKPGPWLHVQVVDGQHGRWIHQTEDKDFRFVPSDNGQSK